MNYWEENAVINNAVINNNDSEDDSEDEDIFKFSNMDND